MEKTTSNKMIHVILAMLSILVVVLSTALFLQGRQLNKLKEELKVNGPTENSRTEINAGRGSSEQSLSQDNEEIYKNKIRKLETQIAEMQEWQDYLEDTLNRYDEKNDSASSKQAGTNTVSRVNMDEIMRRSYSSRFDAFFEENNYPPELKEKLVDLYIERQNAMRDRMPDMQGIASGNSKANLEELRRQSEEINAEYDEKLADLLSAEGLASLKEYEKSEMERSFLRDFKNMLGDDALEKEQEKKLIALMYNDRQISQEEMSKMVQPYEFNGNQPDKETMDRMRKESYERMKQLYGNYAESAEGILSESQMQKFEGYVNMRKASLDYVIRSSQVNITNREREKVEE